MFKSLISLTVLGILSSIAMLMSFCAYAEPMAFSYRFEGNRFPAHTWTPGSLLSGRIDGTVDQGDPDQVIINSFGKVFLNRPGFTVFEFDAIDASEFRGFDGPPFMSFSGESFGFIACPEGFTVDLDGDGVFDDCNFGRDAGGGFLMELFASAADGTGDSVCRDEDPDEQRRIDGCRVTDFPIPEVNWSLVVLSDTDDDGVPDDEDNCSNTVIPESLPTKSLRVGRYALVDGDNVFDTANSIGEGPKSTYTIADTAGCSCTQIIEAQGLGGGHTKFGCSISSMDDWISLVNP